MFPFWYRVCPGSSYAEWAAHAIHQSRDCKSTIIKDGKGDMAFYDDPGGQTRYDAGVLYDDVSPAPAGRKKLKITLNLSKKTILDAIAYCRLIVQKLTGNTKFTTPDPALTALTTAATEAETANTAYESSKETTKQLLTVRNQKWDAMNALITKEAAYVGGHSDTTADVESAGFSATPPASPTQIPAQVINLSVTQGDNNGALDQHWDPDPTAKSYELQTSTDPMTDSSFTHRDTVTKSSCTTTGLTSGTRIWSRVRAVNPAGKGPWSEPVSKIVP